MTDNDKTDQKNNARSAFDKKKRRGPDDVLFNQEEREENVQKLMDGMKKISDDLEEKGYTPDELREITRQEIEKYRAGKNSSGKNK